MRPHFARNPSRRGFWFCFTICSVIGLGIAANGWWAIHTGRGADIEHRFGAPAIRMVYLMAIMGVSSGVVVGLLNRWVASALAAATVGLLAVFPSALWLGFLKLGPTGRFTAVEIIAASLALSLVGGGAYGLILYRR